MIPEIPKTQITIPGGETVEMEIAGGDFVVDLPSSNGKRRQAYRLHNWLPDYVGIQEVTGEGETVSSFYRKPALSWVLTGMNGHPPSQEGVEKRYKPGTPEHTALTAIYIAAQRRRQFDRKFTTRENRRPA